MIIVKTRFFCYILISHPLVPPQISPFSFGDEPLNIDEIAGVQCMVPKGDLPLEIHWTLNSEPIISMEKGFTLQRSNFRTSTLTIESLEGHHRGVYRCMAKNEAGITEFSAELFVNGTIL